MTQLTDNWQDDPFSIGAAIVVGTIGTMIFLVMPGLLGSIVDGTQLTIPQAGLVISADLVGLGTACALASFWMHRFNWRVLSGVGLCVVVIGNLACALFDTFPAIFAIRTVVGIGEGILTAVMYAMLGQTRNPDRSFALYLVFEMIVGAAYLWYVPETALRLGVEIAFLVLAAISAIGFFFLNRIPTKSPDEEERIGDSRSKKGSLARWAFFGLSCNFIFFSGLSATWSYIDRIGISAQMDVATIGKALSVSLLGSLTGAGISAIWGVRNGRVLPITVGLVISLLCLMKLAYGFSTAEFFVVAFFYNFGWSGCHPYLSGLMSTFKNSSIVVLTAAVQTLGMAAGPITAAFILSDDEFRGVYLLSFVLLLVAYPMVILLCRHVSSNGELAAKRIQF